jgi:beta-galactosidase/beta-glucuronidase
MGAATSIPRPEYPRPQWQRERWLNLNGEWEFDFDESGEHDLGAVARGERRLKGRITVPFTFESPLSGIGDTTYHDRVVYAKDIEVPEGWPLDRVLLHFGAVDYEARVTVNGRNVLSHRGGQTPFGVDIAPFLDGRKARIVVEAADSPSVCQPRGKQAWRSKSFECFYTRTTGVWQTAWLEPTARSYVRDARFYPDIDRSQLRIVLFVEGARTGQTVSVAASFHGKPVSEARVDVGGGTVELTLPVPKPKLWSPEEPNLYDLDIRLTEGRRTVDRVSSYFGMRKVSIENGKWCLNGSPYYQRLVLDQGFWPDGIWTPPTDEAIRRDIELAKAFGFNGARKHQKVEDPRFYYWADKLGYLVWAEFASAHKWNPAYEEAFAAEWLEAVERDLKHPSIVVWTPFNECWGVLGLLTDRRISRFVEDVVAKTRALDPTRTVNDNDGYEHTASGDLLTVHDYDKDGSGHFARYGRLKGRAGETIPLAHREHYIRGVEYGGQPILITEYGGIGYRTGFIGAEEWGYHETETDEAAYMARFESIHRALHRCKAVQGFCYTQLTDVEQEINGLCDYERRPKVAPERIAPIVRGERGRRREDA